MRQIDGIVWILTVLFFLPGGVHAQGASTGGEVLAPTDLERVIVGQPAPDFTLEDAYGNRVAHADFRGQKNVVLVFYRGHW